MPYPEKAHDDNPKAPTPSSAKVGEKVDGALLIPPVGKWYTIGGLGHVDTPTATFREVKGTHYFECIE
jgi:hypothetical protein